MRLALKSEFVAPSILSDIWLLFTSDNSLSLAPYSDLGYTKCDLFLAGGGGVGGVGGGSTSTSYPGGGGGGGGGGAKHRITDAYLASFPSIIEILVGLGGTSVTRSGGNTSIGDLIAYGGGGGGDGHAGAAGTGGWGGGGGAGGSITGKGGNGGNGGLSAGGVRGVPAGGLTDGGGYGGIGGSATSPSVPTAGSNGTLFGGSMAKFGGGGGGGGGAGIVAGGYSGDSWATDGAAGYHSLGGTSATLSGSVPTGYGGRGAGGGGGVNMTYDTAYPNLTGNGHDTPSDIWTPGGGGRGGSGHSLDEIGVPVATNGAPGAVLIRIYR